MKPKKTIAAICLCFLCFGTSVGLQATPTIYEQLCDLNNYWLAHPSSDAYLQQRIEFADHEQLIRLHLMTVENTLARADISHLNAEQRANRSRCLSILHDYWQSGIFPQNTYHNTTIPYFIDVHNTACAVGHLIRETGYEAVACRIADEMNYAYIAQIPYPEIPQWANEMGFTVAELKWIQPSYAPPLAINTNITDATCGSYNGSIEATVTENWDGGGEVTPDNVRWFALSNGATGLVGQSQNIDNLRSGLYKMRIDGGGGMFAYIDKMATLSDADAPQITATIQDETCIGSKDGRIEIAISSGTAPYSIAWYNQHGDHIGNGAVLENLSGWQGTISMFSDDIPQYIAEITDANGCKRLATYQVQLINQTSAYAWATMQQPTCGNNNGSIQLQYYLPGSTFAWSHDPTLTNDAADNLAAGHYTVLVTDTNGCTYETFADLYNDSVYPAGFASSFINQPSYCGQNIGAITCPEGFSYTWSHNPNLNTHHAENLSVGYYTITLTDINGCQFVYTTYISDYGGVYAPFDVQLVNANSQNGQLGSINLGTDVSEFIYAWSHDSGLNTSFANNLTSGMYSVTISGLQGCELVQNFMIYDEVNWSNGIQLPSITMSTTQIGSDLHINCSTSASLSLLMFSLYDINGRKVAQTTTPNNSHNAIISMNNLPLGVYLLELQTGKLRQSIKVMKR